MAGRLGRLSQLAAHRGMRSVGTSRAQLALDTGVIRKNKRRPISWPASRSGFQSVLMMQPAQQRLRDDSKADQQAMVVGAPARRLALRIWDARSQTRMR